MQERLLVNKVSFCNGRSSKRLYLQYIETKVVKRNSMLSDQTLFLHSLTLIIIRPRPKHFKPFDIRNCYLFCRHCRDNFFGQNIVSISLKYFVKARCFGSNMQQSHALSLRFLQSANDRPARLRQWENLLQNERRDGAAIS